MMYLGLRRELVGNDDFTKSLSDLGKNNLEESARNYINEECVLVYAHNFPNHKKTKPYVGLTFSKGKISEVRQGTIFFNPSNFGFGLKSIYDIMPVKEIPFAIPLSNPLLRNYSVFTFEEGAGNESEKANVIHTHALPAFLYAKAHLKGSRSFLRSQEQVTPGHCFYEQRFHND
jgi:hypothetical protein